MNSLKEVDRALTYKIWYERPDLFFQDIFGLRPYAYQADFMKIWRNPEDHKRVLIVAAGGTGKTLLLAGVALYYVTVIAQIRKEPKEVIILSGSLLQAKNVYKYIRNAISRNEFLQELVSEFRQSDTVFKDGSSIKALASSLTAVQGQHADMVIVDEAALVEDFLLDDCYRIIGAHDGIMIWSGTPTVYESKFVRIFEEEESKQKKGEETLWEIWTWSAKDCPRLRSQMEEARNRLPEDMWRIFWEGRPYPLTGTLIPRDAMIEATRGITRFEPREDWKVIIGCDWGWRDPTAIVIVQTDGTKYEVLEAHMFKETDFDLILDFIESKAKQYSVHRIFVDAEDKGENLRLRKRGLPVFEVAFNKEKAMLQARLRDLFVKNRVKIPDEDLDNFQDLIYQLRTYTWTKKSGEDLVDALMLALKEFEPRETTQIYIAKGKKRRRRKPPFRVF